MRGHIAVPVLLVALLAVLLGAAAPTTVTPRDDAQPAPTATGTPGPPPIPRFPTRTATPVDTSTDEALEVLRRSDAAMNELHSAGMRSEVRSRAGPNNMPFEEAEYRFAAPDRWTSVYRYKDYPEIETVVIGRDSWERSVPQGWKHSWHAWRYVWPRYERYQREPGDWYGPVQNVMILREEDLKGAPTWVLAYEKRFMSIEGPFDVFSTEWIDQGTYRLLQGESYDNDVWGSGGLQVSRFTDFNAPVTIEPPADGPPPGAPARLALPWISLEP